MSFLKAQVSFLSSFASIFSAIKHNSFILFLAQTLYTLFKRSPLQCKFLRFLSALDKIRHIPHVNFELAGQFLFNCKSFFNVMTYNSPANFKLIHFQLQTKVCHQGPNLETFKYSGENLPNSSYQFLEPQVSFSSNFASILSAIKHKSSVLFQLKHYILWSKAAH